MQALTTHQEETSHLSPPLGPGWQGIGSTADEQPGLTWMARYVAALLAGFVPLYLLTRSSSLIGDGEAFIAFALEADPAGLHYGGPGHFIQVPLTHYLWLALESIGLPVPLGVVFLGLSLLGTLAAIVFVGLIAGDLLRSQTAAWLGAILFGTSLHTWTQWNGELSGPAIAFATAGLFLALRGRIALPAFLWALSVLSHSEFALAAPAFIVAVWMAHSTATTSGKLLVAARLLGLAAATTMVVLLVGSRAIGKWNDTATLVDWLRLAYDARQPDIVGPEVIRATKGLVTAHTVAGHYWRDILTGRGAWSNPWFVLASTVGFLVLGATGALMVAAWQRRPFLIAIAWLVPFQVLFNWWFIPTVEKYHAGALPGLTLLVTTGLIHIGSRLHVPLRHGLYAAYVCAFAGLNLVGAVLPMQAAARDTVSAELEIRQLNDSHGGNAVFLSCDDPSPISRAQVEYLRIRSIWTGTVPDIQDAILSWTTARISEGNQAYLLDRWCLPEEWITEWSQERFDLFFLEQYFDLVATPVAGVPVARVSATNPFAWRRGDIFRLDPAGSAR